MIPASSSSTLRAARKLVTEPLACLERRWTSSTSFGYQQQRSYSAKRPASGKSRRQPQSIPTTTQLKSRTNRPPSNFRTKVNPLDDNPEGTKRPLEPYVLSKRLVDLANNRQLDEAVNMLQNSPLDASNVPTWNTLLLHCMKEKRFKLGFKLFTDMKRRGFRPNFRTYNVLLSGLSRIDNWEEHSIQFKNAQALWRGFLERIESLKKINPKHEEIDPNPAGFYVWILGANKDYNAVFDVLKDLDEEGPFSPTEFIYSNILRCIAHRTQLAPGDKEDVGYRNASDAKLVWKDLTKRAVKNPEILSDHVVVHFIRALMNGRPADKLYAFDVVHDHFGLSKPGEERPPSRIKVTPMVLDSALLLCLRTQKYRLCIHYVQQIIDEAIVSGQKTVPDHGNMEKVLQSYAAMTIAGSAGESDRAVETIEWMHQYHALGWDVKPRPITYGWALMSCWRGGDWASAARITELMTGCHAEDFADGSKTSSSPRLDRRTQDRTIAPNARDMSCMLRAALASGDVVSMRQCLRMATFFGGLRSANGTRYMDAYLAQGQLYTHLPTSTASKQEPFYSTKVTSTLADVLTRVLEGTNPAADTPEMKVWRGLRVRVKKILRESVKPKVKTPDSELEPLGSAGGLEAVDRFVDYDLATRSQKSSRITRR